MAGYSIAPELLSSFSMANYREYCRTINECDAICLADFDELCFSMTHFVDIRNCFIDGQFNPNHVLDYFTRFSNMNCIEMRAHVLEFVKADREYWVHIASIVLPLRPIGFDSWLSIMESPYNACDKLFLFMLSKLHLRHTVVYTKTRLWSTVYTCDSMSEVQLHSEYDLHLIYL